MNDKITGGAQQVGFCCPFAYFCGRKGKHNTDKRVAKELGIGVKAVEYNKRKFREGTLVCLKLSICQPPKEEDKPNGNKP